MTDGATIDGAYPVPRFGGGEKIATPHVVDRRSSLLRDTDLPPLPPLVRSYERGMQCPELLFCLNRWLGSRVCVALACRASDACKSFALFSFFFCWFFSLVSSSSFPLCLGVSFVSHGELSETTTSSDGASVFSQRRFITPIYLLTGVVTMTRPDPRDRGRRTPGTKLRRERGISKRWWMSCRL